LTGAALFCSWCAAPLDAASQETTAMEAEPGRTMEAAAVQSRPPLGSRPASSSVDEGRFLPGTVIAGRYRVAGLLGRGGMGEVYRATDLTLGQAVALKFLPESLNRNERAVARFYNEVRMARQVTHPNVCRVYDIGSFEGLHYISMEFVDGEDLASLLRRIGRLPVDKAVETARRLCAGLAAAHDKGVLHRDLKPANVMIDGRGQVIVMDFGLSGLTEQLQADVRSGTPAYMSPEQLAGAEVSVKSDLYALGLVLYELFTGRRAFEAASVMELMQLQERGAPPSISSVVKDLDPVVERVILRCLQHDPRLRPASALAVAAALPGGDPLAAAMIAGETPSPELIAAAGETDGLRPWVAMAWLAATLAGIALVGVLAMPYYITAKVPMDVPPDALARDARHLLEGFGYAARPADTAWGLDYDASYLDYLNRHHDLAAARWRNPAAGQPAVIYFWYRESPRAMAAELALNTLVQVGDPPLDVSGMARLLMDTQGKLRRIDVVPPQVEPPAPAASSFDWSRLFRAAGLDQNQFQTAEPEWTPLANWDVRAAWTGADAPTGAKLRVEAAAWRGRPVFFRIVGPWTKPERMTEGASSNQVAVLLVIYLALAAAGVVAWKNFRSGRGDRQGAWRLALLYFAGLAGGAALASHHVATQAELSLFWRVVSKGAINAGVVWMFYIALEPWVRRRWPHILIAWTRFTVKGIRDPLVGRGVLAGTAAACVWAALTLVRLRLHGPTGEPAMVLLDPLDSLRLTAAAGLTSMAGALFGPLLILFLLFVLRIILRKQWAAAIVCVLLVGMLNTMGTAYPAADWSINLLLAALAVFLLLRFGLVALIACGVLSDFLLGLPRTLDFSLWYAPMGMLPLVLVALAAIYGFHISLAGQTVFKGELE
jgi:serine/threonine-protein kinase